MRIVSASSRSKAAYAFILVEQLQADTMSMALMSLFEVWSVGRRWNCTCSRVDDCGEDCDARECGLDDRPDNYPRCSQGDDANIAFDVHLDLRRVFVYFNVILAEYTMLRDRGFLGRTKRAC